MTQENKLIEMHKLFNDTYLAVFEKFIAIAKVNEKGEIVRLSTFGKEKPI